MDEPLRTFEGYQQPPDPVTWKATHGVEPYQLTNVPPKFFHRAAAAVMRDDSTLNAAKAIAAKAALDLVLEHVHFAADLDAKDLVLYRAEDRTFWVYPTA